MKKVIENTKNTNKIIEQEKMICYTSSEVKTMTEELIKRINELAKKSRDEGLTDEEKKEQQELRQKYIESFRQGVKNTLSGVYIVDEDGNEKKLQRRPKNNIGS